MRISDWSSDVCSSDLAGEAGKRRRRRNPADRRDGDDDRQPALSRRHLRWRALRLRVEGGLYPGQSGGRARTPRYGGRGPRLCDRPAEIGRRRQRSEEHTSELQSLIRISYAVFCLKKKRKENARNEQTKHANINKA